MKVGDSVGNYRVVARLGRGGHGDIWLAEHVLVGKRVAVKVIAAARAARAEARERFLVEARAVAGIAHPQVVQLFDFGASDGGDLYFTMEHLEGRSLRALLDAERRLPAGRALRIAAQVADGLAAAHARSVIHRDLKPDNVFLVAEGAGVDRVKVLDFGLARRMDSSLTAEGARLGTPSYMAPEQCAGKRSLDGRADVYALGCLLYELLDGAPPFRGPADQVLRAQRSRLPAVLSDAPPRVWALVARALAKAPDNRFPSMGAFRDALTDEAGSSGARLPDEGAIPAIEQPLSPSTAKTLERAPQPGSAATVETAAPAVSRRWWMIVALVAVAAAASPVAWQLRKRTPAPTAVVPPPPRRTLALRSIPPGATVVVGGIGYGATPTEIALDPGVVDVELTLPGFEPWRGAIDPASHAAVEVQLIPLAVAPAKPRAPPAKKIAPGKLPPRLTDEEGLLPPALDP